MLSVAGAQVDEQHPYRQAVLKTRVALESSREKDARYRYSSSGNLYSSDRRYTQKVRLRITVTNPSAATLENIRVQYRIYKRDLSRNEYSVAAAGEMTIPQIPGTKTETLYTGEAVCQYRLWRSTLVAGNRLSKSGEKYAGYVVIYRDPKGPVCWDMSSQTMYAEYARELHDSKNLSADAASSKEAHFSPSASGKSASLPYSADTTVYVAKTGRKFHQKDCRYVRSGARPISREEALKLGYTPCSVCRP